MTFMVASLASGSSGNAYYLQSPEGAVLVDAGMSGRRLVEAIVRAGGDPELVRGIIVTHDHHDHIAGVGPLHRRHGWRLWMTAGTREAAAARLGKVTVETIRAGSGLEAAGFTFEFAATPHDGAEPVAVTAEVGGVRCGVFTDLGHTFHGLAESLERLDFAFLESNYDPRLLAANPRYPPPLKSRIMGRGGHLSNDNAAVLVQGMSGDRLRSVVLAHLSEENNRPDLALEHFRRVAAGRIGGVGMRVGVAPRHDPMRLCRVG